MRKKEEAIGKIMMLIARNTSDKRIPIPILRGKIEEIIEDIVGETMNRLEFRLNAIEAKIRYL